MGITKIHSFSLVQEGLAGVKADVDYQGIDKKGNTVIDLVKSYHRPLPIPSYLDEALTSLKYYFLITTGHWDFEWDKYLRSDKKPVDASKPLENFEDFKKVMALYEGTKVLSVKYNGSFIVLKGEIRTVGDKVIKVTSPNILEDDDEDINFLFSEFVEKCVAALDSVKTYLASSKGDLMKGRDFLMRTEKSPERRSALESMSDAECEAYMIEELSKKNFLIMKGSDLELMDINEEEEPTTTVEALLASIPEKELVPSDSF
jgi:hypothetical protein